MAQEYTSGNFYLGSGPVCQDRPTDGVSNKMWNRGGFWRNQRPIHNQETKELLEVLMKESQLTLIQRQQIRNSLQGGDFQLPLQLPAKARDSGRRCASANSKNSTGRQSSSSLGRGLRSRQSILASGAYERQRFRPDTGTDRGFAEEKERLQNLMSFGQKTSPAQVGISQNNVSEMKKCQGPLAQIQAEVNERRAFLEEMKNLGLGKKYATIIEGEISQRLREMQIMEKAAQDEQQTS